MADRFKLLKYLPVLVLLSASLVVIYSVYQKQNTGVFEVSSIGNSVGLYITQDGKSAVYIGQGSAKVRVAGGTYFFIASDGGRKSVARSTVENNDVTYVKLPELIDYAIPNQDSVNFKGFNALIEKGWTTDDIASLQRYCFLFDPTASEVDIIESSVSREPRDRYSESDNISYRYTLSIDNQTYTAKATRSLSGTSIYLALYNDSGKLVFSSTSVSNKGD